MGTIQEAIQLVVDATPAEQGAKAFDAAMGRVIESERAAQRGTAALEESLKRLGDREAYAADSQRKLAGGFGAQAAALRGLDARIRDLGTIVAKSAQQFQVYGNSVLDAARKSAVLDAEARKAQTSLSGTVSGITRVAALFGAGLGIRASIDAISGFERAIAQVGTISRASADELRLIRDQSAELGATTEKTATQAAEGALLLARAGFGAQRILAALPGALKLSVAAALDLGESSEIAANSLAQFQLAASETDRVTNALLVTASSGNTDVRQLAEALKFAGSVAGAVGQQIETVSAALGVLGDRGIQGSLAGRALRGIFLDLRSPTVEARQELLRFGADLAKLDPRVNDLTDIADELGKALRAGADAGRIFGAEQAAQAIILGQSADRIREIVEAQKQWNTATDDVANTLTNTLSGSIKAFQSALEGVVIKAGDDGLSGALRGALDRITEVVRKLGGLEQGVGKFGAQTTIAAAALETLGVALAISAAGKFIGFLSQATTLIPRLVASAAAGAKALTTLNVAAGATPWGAIGTAIAGVVTIGLAYSRRLDEIAHSQDEAAKSAKDFELAISGIQRTIDQGSRQPITGPLTQSAAIRQQIKQVEALKQAIIDASAVGKESKLEFANANEFLRRISDVDAAIKELQGRIGSYRLTARGDPIALSSPEDVKRLEALKTLRDSLTKQPVSIGSIVAIPAGETLRGLFDAAGLADDFKRLTDQARQVTGLDEPFVVASDAVEVLRGKLPDLTDRIEKLRDTYESATATTKDYSIAIRRGVETLAEEQTVLADRQRLLSQVEAGTLSLSDAERVLNDEREVRSRTAQAIKAAEQVNGKLSEEAAKAIEKEVRALVAGKSAADLWETRLRGVGKATADVTNDAEKLVESLEKQAAGLRNAEDPARKMADVMDELRKSVAEGSAEFDNLSSRASAAINEIIRAQDRQRVSEAKEREEQRAAQSLDRFRDIIDGLSRQRDAYLLTRDALDELTAVEEVRRLGLGRQAEERARQLAQEIASLQKIREIAGSAAGGVSDALRALKDGASGREALGALVKGAGDRLFESSIQRLEEQITTGLTSALGSAFGVTASGQVAGATPGEQGIIDAVRAVETAVRQGTAQSSAEAKSSGTGGASGGGFDFGSFAGSLAIAGIGIGLSALLGRRGGGRGDTGDPGGFRVLSVDRSSGAPTFNQQRITVNQYVAPDRVRLTAKQASRGRDAIWRR